MLAEFREFLNKYGVIGLAIAVIIGGKLNVFVTSLVNDLLMPIIFRPALNMAGVSRIADLQYHGIFYGKVVGAGIEFLIVAFFVFYCMKKLMPPEAPKA
ncbi:MAG: MscL family protein [Bacteriovoracaceae bacterium]